MNILHLLTPRDFICAISKNVCVPIISHLVPASFGGPLTNSCTRCTWQVLGTDVAEHADSHGLCSQLVAHTVLATISPQTINVSEFLWGLPFRLFFLLCSTFLTSFSSLSHSRFKSTVITDPIFFFLLLNNSTLT